MIDKLTAARTLREIARLLTLSGADRFKVQAYDRGARAVEGLVEDLDTLVIEARLTEISGIGKTLAATLEELHRTGKSTVLEKLEAALPPGTRELSAVLGVPRIKALQETLGITTLTALEEACAAGRVRGVKGFGAKTEAKILADLRALAAAGDAAPGPARALLFAATAATDGVLAWARALPGVTRAEIAGALRRRAEVVERVDVLVAAADPAAAEAAARPAPPAAGVPVVLRAVEPARFAAALLEATGSEAHVAKLRVVAAHRGVALDAPAAAGALPPGAPGPAGEEELYARLGLPYIPPELREDQGEVEAAVRGTLPADLVAHGDLAGAVHCHTLYSDGRNTVEEMARAAEALGLRYITITDHSPSATYASGVSLDRLKRQWEEIARTQEKVSVRLLRGTESDILGDGALDYPDEVLADMDVVIASIHNRMRMDTEQMTRRLVAAMRQPRFKIWGHGLGRLLERRPPIACRVEEVLDAVAESRAAVEINGDPHRLDLEPRWIRAARARGIRFVISADAHSVPGLGALRWGVDMARRGWVRKSEVLNTLGVEEFKAAVRP